MGSSNDPLIEEPLQEEGKKTPRPSDSERPEVIRLCNLLADAVAADGTRRPEPGKRWWDACRLLLDKDLDSSGEEMELRVRRVEFVIRWIHETPGNFWAPNILSMPKLREKWPQLVKEIRREQDARRKVGGSSGRADDRTAERLKRIDAARGA